MARKRPVKTGHIHPQPKLRRRCEELVALGLLTQTAPGVYEAPTNPVDQPKEAKK